MTTLSVNENRVIELEIRVTEQERQIEDLSITIADQWKTIDQLSKKLIALTDRFLILEEQTTPGIPVTRPPHW